MVRYNVEVSFVLTKLTHHAHELVESRAGEVSRNVRYRNKSDDYPLPKYEEVQIARVAILVVSSGE